MYKAKLLDKIRENDKVRVWIEFKDGARIYTQDFVLDNIDFLKSEVQRRIDVLVRNDTFMEADNKKDIDLTPPTPGPAPTPDPVQLKKGEFRDKLQELEKKQKYVSLGLIDEASIKSLKDEVKQLGIDAEEL